MRYDCYLRGSAVAIYRLTLTNDCKFSAREHWTPLGIEKHDIATTHADILLNTVGIMIDIRTEQKQQLSISVFIRLCYARPHFRTTCKLLQSTDLRLPTLFSNLDLLRSLTFVKPSSDRDIRWPFAFCLYLCLCQSVVPSVCDTGQTDHILFGKILSPPFSLPLAHHVRPSQRWR